MPELAFGPRIFLPRNMSKHGRHARTLTTTVGSLGSRVSRRKSLHSLQNTSRHERQLHTQQSGRMTSDTARLGLKSQAMYGCFQVSSGRVSADWCLLLKKVKSL